MSKLEITSNYPAGSFDLTYAGKHYVVTQSVKQWVMTNGGETLRLGMGSLYWTTALRRAIEQIEDR
jgi:hypothetical protein